MYELFNIAYAPLSCEFLSNLGYDVTHALDHKSLGPHPLHGTLGFGLWLVLSLALSHIFTIEPSDY